MAGKRGSSGKSGGGKYRSAKSGRYVTKKYGKSHKSTTVKESHVGRLMADPAVMANDVIVVETSRGRTFLKNLSNVIPLLQLFRPY